MDQKSIIVDDPFNLPRDILITEYQTLCKHFNELRKSDDNHRQQIHGLTRELQTAVNARNFLSAELDFINADHSKEIEEINQKHRFELEEIRRQMSSCKEANEALEIETDSLQQEIEALKGVCVVRQNEQVAPVESNQSFYAEKMSQLEEQNDELAQVVKNLQQQLTETLKTNLQFENRIEDLKDRLQCAEENLLAKREELEEKNELYETTQERLTQLSGELNALRMESDTAGKRGNSLFAEVDDQRQKMKVILDTQKSHYIAMKRELEESRHEIRKLKRENGAMYKEIEVCTHLFLNAEQHHTEKLNERIAELLRENEVINQKLIFTEECLSKLTQQRDVKWLDPMITLCKTETKDLKDKLYRCSLQKVNIADALRKSQEEIARWRFEALKSRCVIAERESLLEDNKIEFSAVSGIDRKVRKIDNENVKPDIGAETQPLLSYKRKSLTNSTNKENSPLAKPSESTFAVGKPASKFAIESTSYNAIGRVQVEKKDQPKIVNISEGDATKQSTTVENSVKFTKSGVTGLTPRNTPKKSSTTRLRLPSTLKSSANPEKTPGGILKQHTANFKMHDDKKVKFANGSVTDSAVERTHSVRRLEKVQNVPKTAIKKRIFITSKKPSDNPEDVSKN